MSVAWTPAADDQLTAALDALARINPSAARQWGRRAKVRTDALANQPGLGAEVPEYGNPAVREVFEPPYRILYRVTDAGGVEVIGLYHSARRLPRTPPG